MPADSRLHADRRALGLRLAGAALAVYGAPTALWARDAPPAWPALQGGDVALWRHAHAPGIGDPPQMRLDDCSTQRNLDAQGLAQAARIGEALRSQALPVTALWSSPWCRCLHTAKAAFPGRYVEIRPAFSSFFSERDRAPHHEQLMRHDLSQWRGPGLLLVVTHQVNITALSGIHPASGEGVLLRRANPGWQVVARLPVS